MKLLTRTSALFIAILMVTLVLGMGTTTEVLAENDYEFRVIVHLADDTFWIPAISGTEEAGEQLGVDAAFTGPSSTEVGEHVAMIEDAIAAGVDGIATSLPDAEAFNDIVAEAREAGIPVVGVNVDAPDSERMSFIGEDAIQAGRILGENILKQVGEGGKVAVGTSQPGQTSLEDRFSGAQEIMDENNIEYEFIDVTSDITSAIERFVDYYTANPDVDGFFGVGGLSTHASVMVIDVLDLQGQVAAGGFDLHPEVLQGISDGNAQFTVDQVPYLQGYYAVHQLYLYNEYGIEPVDINTSAGVVDESNVEDVLELSEDGYR